MLVTNGDWRVSTTTNGLGTGCTLSVYKMDKIGRITEKADCDGMFFKTNDAAREYAFNNGYLKEYKGL
jgi:hypothetical protein